ncbi:MAG: sigma-54 dependent transcriptional regulator [candidate division KSB1 bacterium]|nr:sigma-54 dependent transcriptional regulator [candidate division KSB1 bacterium]
MRDELVDTLPEASAVGCDFPEVAERSGSSAFGFDYYYPMVSHNPQIRQMLSLIKKVARSNATVLIQGETGTGKEMMAGLIQLLSLRADKPYIQVNCAALPDQLLESELFGHERGAYTGAYTTRIGKFELADKGTLFLDEVGDMALPTQAKILRVLQEQRFSRLGGNRLINVDVRLIAATNKDLEREIELGNFRLDLYYRLNVVQINIPPLRDRREDIPILAEYFRRKFASEMKKEVGGFTQETMRLLQNHSWPGNIRELRNLVERAVIVVGEGKPITPNELSLSGRDYFAAGGQNRRRSESTGGGSLSTLNLAELERTAILQALERTGWVQKEAAQLLGISPRALNYKIALHNITHQSWKKHV